MIAHRKNIFLLKNKYLFFDNGIISCVGVNLGKSMCMMLRSFLEPGAGKDPP